MTARLTSRAGAKAGLSDPAVKRGIAVAQRIKGTPGITGSSCPRVHIDGRVWHLKTSGVGRQKCRSQHRLITGKPYRFGGGNPVGSQLSASPVTTQANVCCRSGRCMELDPVTTEAARPRWRSIAFAKSRVATIRRPLARAEQGEEIVCAAGNGGMTRDVGSSHPGAGVGPKGWAVRPLKRYASWVQNVVRQWITALSINLAKCWKLRVSRTTS